MPKPLTEASKNSSRHAPDLHVHVPRKFLPSATIQSTHIATPMKNSCTTLTMYMIHMHCSPTLEKSDLVYITELQVQTYMYTVLHHVHVHVHYAAIFVYAATCTCTLVQAKTCTVKLH